MYITQYFHKVGHFIILVILLISPNYKLTNFSEQKTVYYATSL